MTDDVALDETGGRGRAATALVDRLLDVGIDGRGPFDSAQQVADSARSGHADAEGAIDDVVRRHTRIVAASGFVTGLGGFVTLPVALPANVAGFYAVGTRMVAATASLRGYDLHLPGVRAAVLLTLVGADADDLLTKAGIVSTGRLANLAAQRLPAPAMMVLNKGIGFRLVSSVGRSTFSRLGKGVPVVGGVLGAGLDSYLVRRIADQARREFPARPTAVL